jgi:DNA-binding XRE family transcriptional regulator
MTTETQTVSDVIVDVRSGLGLTQVEFAALIGVTDETVSRWEKGTRKPTKRHGWPLVQKVATLDRQLAEKLCTSLGYSLQVVCGGQPPAHTPPMQSIENEVGMLVNAYHPENGIGADLFEPSLLSAAYRQMLTARPAMPVDPVIERDVRGSLSMRSTSSEQDVIDGFEQLGYRILHEVRHRHDRRVLFVRPGFGAVTWVFAEAYVIVNFAAFESQVKDIMDVVFRHTARRRRKPGRASVSALMSDGDGVEIRSVGAIGVPLERDNYPETVLVQYDRMCREFQSDEPSARFVVIDGPPGTGKTFMIRALAQQCERARVTLVFPHMLPQLITPLMLPVLLRETVTTAWHKKLVLVIEDGDLAIVKRGTDNMSELSALLNMTDGMLGSALDLRIVVTTNADITRLDPAVMRRGRLLEHIKMPPLDPEHAWRVLKRLCPAAERPAAWPKPNGGGARRAAFVSSSDAAAGVALSDVYEVASGLGWTAPTETTVSEAHFSNKRRSRRKVRIYDDDPDDYGDDPLDDADGMDDLGADCTEPEG